MKLNIQTEAERKKSLALERLVKSAQVLCTLIKPDGGTVEIKVKMRGRKRRSASPGDKP